MKQFRLNLLEADACCALLVAFFPHKQLAFFSEFKGEAQGTVELLVASNSHEIRAVHGEKLAIC